MKLLFLILVCLMSFSCNKQDEVAQIPNPEMTGFINDSAKMVTGKNCNFEVFLTKDLARIEGKSIYVNEGAYGKLQALKLLPFEKSNEMGDTYDRNSIWRVSDSASLHQINNNAMKTVMKYSFKKNQKCP